MEMGSNIKPNITLLQGIPLFEGLPRPALEALVERARIIHLPERKFLFHKGDQGDSMFVVASGLIRIGVVAPDGRQVSYALIRPGQLFGEIAVFDGGSRTADASALADSSLLALSRAEITDFLVAYPAYALRLIAVLCQRMRNADQLIEDILFQTLPARVAKHLLVLADLYGDGGDSALVRISQQGMAAEMGACRESINRLFSKWEQAGVVALWRGGVTIQDREALENYILE